MQEKLMQVFYMQHSFTFLGTGVAVPLMARPQGLLVPTGRSIEKAKSQEPKKKSVYVRKEFPETWLWTEEMVK